MIAEVLVNPRENSWILAQIPPQAFVAATSHRTTWQAMNSLRAQGIVIDPVEVGWEAEIISARRARAEGKTPDVLSVAQLRTLKAEPPSGDVDRAIERVLDAAQFERAGVARQSVHQVAANRTLSTTEAVTTATTAVDSLVNTAQRLSGVQHGPTSLARTLEPRSRVPPSPTPRTSPRQH
jgi:hypothetical protein